MHTATTVQSRVYNVLLRLRGSGSWSTARVHHTQVVTACARKLRQSGGPESLLVLVHASGTADAPVRPPRACPQVHDIEDLVAAGRQQIGCPYYAARKLAETAEIVFCPYNYIVDPVIRESVSIDLRRTVVIFDEAHNIEDTARDAASVDLTMQNIEDALADVAGAPVATGACTACSADCVKA